MQKARYLSLGAVVAFVIFPAHAAEAGIKCKDGFQSVNGAEISTPYCNDEHLAALARERGSRVTAAQIRANPNTKEEVCRWLGDSGPASDYCNQNGGRDSTN